MKQKKRIDENLLNKFIDSFFDGLKTGAINTALKKAENHPNVPTPIVDRMKQIDKLARELERDLKYYS